MSNSFFIDDIPVYHASCPGRMDVMGGIADYSGSLLLQIPVKQTTSVAMQKRTDHKIILRSLSDKNEYKEFSIDINLVKNKSLNEAGEIIRSLPGGDWATYIIGCFLVLKKEKGIETDGASISISSSIPLGKGISSSAALEVATMHALCNAYNFSLDPEELAVLAQKAENLVVGAPCGLMDQLSVELGQKKKLLPLICQPCTVMPPLHIPAGIEFCGIDSGIRHAVSGASYSDVRAAAFMGYTIIAGEKGIDLAVLQKARQDIDWTFLPYNGYLANITVEDFESNFEKLLPESMSGEEFIEKSGITIDRVTSIEEQKKYYIKACAGHPVYENARVNSFLQLLKQFKKSDSKQDIVRQLGELMYQSHDSYSAVGLGNSYTDEIVQMVKDSGIDSGVYGARITGGGSGGTVVVLCFGKEGKQNAREIFKMYKKKYKKKIFFFHGSSDGASILNRKG